LLQHTKTGKNIPNNQIIYTMTIKYTKMAIKHAKWLQNTYTKWTKNQHLPLLDPPKLTQILIFGLKIYHLTTLIFSST
jgi:hypothetical protein